MASLFLVFLFPKIYLSNYKEAVSLPGHSNATGGERIIFKGLKKSFSLRKKIPRLNLLFQSGILL